ncbi:putative peptidase S33 family protein [Lyophyllum shimeji]|uniref:Proline iminopeptidase n=1 Tax=Lyophyllum shimeji TaxID=47721 RepID=A0A9P3PRU3_LYOSH|nr:putative peptidase S33 family protein [Lyophyllum shimeji]
MSKALYPAIDPYHKGFLDVTGGHKIHYEVSGLKIDEESGAVVGAPVVFLHGGPGRGTHPHDRRFFNPHKYRIILFDQRGAGKSTPSANSGKIENNTTNGLHNFGGGWGSILALAYAQRNPCRVRSMVLRGISLASTREREFLFKNGPALAILPDTWKNFCSPIPEDEQDDMIKAYNKRLNPSDDNAEVDKTAANMWIEWVRRTYRILSEEVDVTDIVKFGSNTKNQTEAVPVNFYAEVETNAPGGNHFFPRIMAHYLANEYFLDEGELLRQRNIAKIREIPIVMIHGRYDIVTPFGSASELRDALGVPAPEPGDSIPVPGAGHSAREPEILRLLVEATDHVVDLP